MQPECSSARSEEPASCPHSEAIHILTIHSFNNIPPGFANKISYAYSFMTSPIRVTCPPISPSWVRSLKQYLPNTINYTATECGGFLLSSCYFLSLRRCIKVQNLCRSVKTWHGRCPTHLNFSITWKCVNTFRFQPYPPREECDAVRTHRRLSGPYIR